MAQQWLALSVVAAPAACCGRVIAAGQATTANRPALKRQYKTIQKIPHHSFAQSAVFAPYICAMIVIDNKLVSDDLIEAQFVCDLVKCKGGCCVDGDAGAPLDASELPMLDAVAEAVTPYLSKRHVAELKRQGNYVYDPAFGWVTPAIDGGICVYAITDELGIVKCGIEKAFNDGKLTNTAAADWKKPISCHLFPVRLAQSADGETEYVNYEPRQTLCKPACKLGKKLKVPVYQFLKEPLIRKYGPDFYEALYAVAQEYFDIENKNL